MVSRSAASAVQASSSRARLATSAASVCRIRTHYFTGRLAKAHPHDSSSRVMSRWRRRSWWRRSIGGGLRPCRRSPERRSRTTSRLSSAYTCLRYWYCFASVRDTMKTRSAMIASIPRSVSYAMVPIFGQAGNSPKFPGVNTHKSGMPAAGNYAFCMPVIPFPHHTADHRQQAGRADRHSFAWSPHRLLRDPKGDAGASRESQMT